MGGGSKSVRPVPPTAAERLNQWAQDFQIDSFSMENLEPHFKGGGGIHISTWPQGIGPASRMLRKGAKNMGWSVKRFLVFHYKSQGSWVGERQSMRVVLIPRFAKQRPTPSRHPSSPLGLQRPTRDRGPVQQIDGKNENFESPSNTSFSPVGPFKVRFF